MAQHIVAPILTSSFHALFLTQQYLEVELRIWNVYCPTNSKGAVRKQCFGKAYPRICEYPTMSSLLTWAQHWIGDWRILSQTHVPFPNKQALLSLSQTWPPFQSKRRALEREEKGDRAAHPGGRGWAKGHRRSQTLKYGLGRSVLMEMIFETPKFAVAATEGHLANFYCLLKTSEPLPLLCGLLSHSHWGPKSPWTVRVAVIQMPFHRSWGPGKIWARFRGSLC